MGATETGLKQRTLKNPGVRHQALFFINYPPPNPLPRLFTQDIARYVTGNLAVALANIALNLRSAREPHYCTRNIDRSGSWGCPCNIIVLPIQTVLRRN